MQYLQKKRDKFYYLLVTDLQKKRDDKISQLFDEDVEMRFLSQYERHSYKTTTQIHLTRFWKDSGAALRVAEHHKKIQQQKGNQIIFELQNMNRDLFLKSIPDDLKIDDYVLRKNQKLKKQELEYIDYINDFRSEYKAISAYDVVKDPWYWLNCPKCGLKPLVWEFNNGRSTACGCGENEYRHHSVEAESVMSYVTRNGGSALGYDSDELRKNWNHWCKTGEFLFHKTKERW